MADPAIPPLLTRRALASALRERGFPITPQTLATMACRGGGPPHARWGRHTLYIWNDALAWAQGRLTVPDAAGTPPSRATKAA